MRTQPITLLTLTATALLVGVAACLDVADMASPTSDTEPVGLDGGQSSPPPEYVPFTLHLWMTGELGREYTREDVEKMGYRKAKLPSLQHPCREAGTRTRGVAGPTGRARTHHEVRIEHGRGAAIRYSRLPERCRVGKAVHKSVCGTGIVNGAAGRAGMPRRTRHLEHLR